MLKFGGTAKLLALQELWLYLYILVGLYIGNSDLDSHFLKVISELGVPPASGNFWL